MIDEQKKANEADKPLNGAAKIDHVIVDEFQDINPLDINLIRVIVKRHRSNITLGGNDDQAICEWRGTTPAYILEPEKFFSGPFQTFTLQANYASLANVVTLAQKLIRNDKPRVDKDTHTSQSVNAEIHIDETRNINESLELLAKLVDEHIKIRGSTDQIALIGPTPPSIRRVRPAI